MIIPRGGPGHRISRRTAVAGIGSAGISWPLAAVAQQTARPYILLVIYVPYLRDAGGEYWPAFMAELHKLGYVRGANLVVENLTYEKERSGELAREVANRKPDVIFTPVEQLAVALKALGVQTPIVTIGTDFVASGLAFSLARPGGSVTGPSTSAGVETVAKRFALLKEAVPATSRIAILTPEQFWKGQVREILTQGALQVGAQAVGAPVQSPANAAAYRSVFAAIARDGVDSLYISSAPENLVHRQIIAQLATEARLPGMCFLRENATAGVLMAYAVDLTTVFRRSASYIDRILKGANPGDLPIEQPTRFALVINLSTAKAIGVTVPPALLARADEVIE
jgi:ABC-type uncharacterized transport system substrate-binding protein